MAGLNLQKPAASLGNQLPIEVLNPHKAAQQYSVKIYSPSDDLAYFVEDYWALNWDLQGKQPFTCEVIPSPHINLTFMVEGARITGVTTGKYSYALEDKGTILGVKFRPGGFYPFWQQSVHLLTDTMVDASQVFGKIDGSLNSSILSLPTNEEVLQAVESLLLEYKPIPDKNVAFVNKIIESLEDEDSPTVGSTARKFNISERSLQELFKTYVGVGLKWVILRSRLQKAAELAARLDSPNWTRIAAELGYSDQSHFVNDFKRIIGKSPTHYAAAIRSGQ